MMNYFYISCSHYHFEAITEEDFRRNKYSIILVGSDIEYEPLVKLLVGDIRETDKTLLDLYKSLRLLGSLVVITNISIEALTEFSKRTAVLNGTSYENPFDNSIKDLK